MFIRTPAQAAPEAAGAHSDLDRLDRDLWDSMIADSTRFFLAHADAQPSAEAYEEAAAFLRESTELPFDGASAKTLLSLYPQSRIKLAVDGGAGGTDTRDAIGFAAAHFYLACSWPTYGDELDIHAFVAALRSAAARVGFPSGTLPD